MKRSATATIASPPSRRANASPSSVRDVGARGPVRSRGVGGREELARQPCPSASRVAGGGEHRAVGGEDRGAPQVRRHLLKAGERGGRIGLAWGRLAVRRSSAPTYRANVSRSEPPGSAIVVACALAALVLALDGYVGYPIVLGAVGLSAAVNLF